MNQIRFFLPIIGLLLIARLNSYEYANPSNGKSGAPGEGNCTECHTPTNTNFSGSLALTGIPNEVRVGQKYTLTLRTSKTRGNAITAGIQLVALNQNNLNAGELSAPTGNSGILTAGNRTYFEHKGTPASFYADSFVVWTVDWTANNVKDNDVVTFYANTLLSDNSQSVTGDLQVHRRLTTLVKSGPPPLVVDATIKQITCNGDNNGGITLVVSGGNSPYNFKWSSNTPANQVNMSAGTYTVTVTSQDTQQIVRTFTLTEPPFLNFSVASTVNINCSGQLNGQATLQAVGGLPPYQVAWPDGGSGLTRSDLGIGRYQVTISDIRGCSKTTQFEITSAINIKTQIGAIHESSPGKNDGLAFVHPTGGTPPYLILWQNGITDDTIKNLSPGTYSVLVADISGCLISDSVVVQSGTCPLNLTSTIVQPVCSNVNSGSIILANISPNNQVTYNWSTGSDSCCLINLSQGSYAVSATDALGCTFQDTFILSDPANLDVSILSLSTPSCTDSPDGSLQVGISGGTPPYSLLWSTGAQTDTIRRLVAGDYHLTVTDSQACNKAFTFNIAAKDVESPQLINNLLTIELNENGQAFLTEAILDTLLVDNCSEVIITSLQDTFRCSDAGTNRIPIQAMDSDGNLLSDTLTVFVQDRIPSKFSLVGSTQFSQCSGFNYPVLVATDNCAVQSVTRIDGLGPSGIFQLGKTTESYLILDRAGNSTNASFDITIEDPLPVQLNVEQPRCSIDSSGSITILPLKDSSNYSVIWNDGFTGFNRSKLPPSLYLITVNDSTGCSKLVDVELVSRKINLTIDSIAHPEKDQKDGFIQLAVEGAVSPYKLVWYRNGASFGETFDFLSLNNLQAGVYRVEIIDAEACIAVVDSIQLGITSAVNADIIAQADFRQFPNPALTEISWQLKPEIILIQLDIFSLNGQAVLSSAKLNDGRITVKELMPGIYFCRWQSSIGNFYTKLIKL